MNHHFLTNFAVISSLVPSYIASANAGEIKNETPITIDFQSKQIQFYGIYAPAKSSARTQGLDAEIAARRNGISYLRSYLARSCEGETAVSAEKTDQSAAAPSWQGIVKSQGSEIYSNGVLKISLVAPLKDVMKDAFKKKPLSLKAKDGSPLALKLPKIPAAALKCGMLSLSVGDKNVTLNPLSVSSDSGAKVVNLSLDGSRGLKPAGSADLALLEGSNLFGGSESSHSEEGNPSTKTSAPSTGDWPSSTPSTSQPAR